MSIQLDSTANSVPITGFLKKKQQITIKGDSLQTTQKLHALAIFWIPLAGLTVAIALALHSGIGLVELGLFAGMYALTMGSITVGFHRLFAHCAFQTNTPIRVILAVLGSMACQGPLIYWVSNHRRHHQYSDLPGDPHSPHFNEDKSLSGLSGLWHAHIGWMYSHQITNTFLFAKDLLRDSVISKVNQLYYLWILLGLVIPAILGGVLTGTWMGACKGFLWGGLVRLFFTYHSTSSVNSITHLYGSRSFDTSEHSQNNIWLALPTFGEAWHNNHHAFPNSAIFGLKWWEIDLGAWVIRILQFTSLVWDVKAPTGEMIEVKKAL